MVMNALLRSLFGCDWGRYIALPDDRVPCHEKATRRIILHNPTNRSQSMLVQLCPMHTSIVTEETNPTPPEFIPA